ncbi:MAG: rhodanese-like domain-containing protein [Clostridia bacterium]|jgi:rhodanese-related sulfurtransferase|nr:rhodanese-like domain-containing protein [Clostridia bacterium]
MKKSLIVVIILIALLLIGCSAVNVDDTEQTQQTAQEPAPAKRAERIDVEPAEFEAQMNGNYVLLDVRSYDEFDEGHIEGATLIPVDELAERWSEIEEYDKILVYCRSGNRSVTASEILLDEGFGEVYNLLGGIGAWSDYKN